MEVQLNSINMGFHALPNYHNELRFRMHSFKNSKHLLLLRYNRNSIVLIKKLGNLQKVIMKF